MCMDQRNKQSKQCTQENPNLYQISLHLTQTQTIKNANKPQLTRSKEREAIAFSLVNWESIESLISNL